MELSIDDTPLNCELKQVFESAQPFPVVVLDDFLPTAHAEALLREATVQDVFQKSNDYIFAKNKFESPRLDTLGEAGARLKKFLLSCEVAEVLSQMYGHRVFVDPDFVGGGLHRGGDGSFLDMHVDFNLHPQQRRWIRELNILLYLNKDWCPEYGGNLDLRNSITGDTRSIEPRFNRLVIMLTKDFTYHGYRPIKFPPGTFRTSIAAYAYSAAFEGEDLSRLRTTTAWAPEGNWLKSLIARIAPPLVTLKQHLMGSSTVRKAKGDK